MLLVTVVTHRHTSLSWWNWIICTTWGQNLGLSFHCVGKLFIEVSLFFNTLFLNPGPLEKHASTNTFAELQRRTYSIHCSLQMTTRGSKTATTFIPFHIKWRLQGRLSNRDLFSHLLSLNNTMLWPQIVLP